MKRVTLLIAMIVLVLALPSGAALAHTHYLSLPNGKTTDLAGGNVEGAQWHPLHCVVHIGTAGTFAMDHVNNPVDIDKVGTFTGSCTAKPGALP